MRYVIGIVALVLTIGCVNPIDPHNPKPIPDDRWVEVDCSECEGIGKVTYDEKHWMVTNKMCEAGTYKCSICQGSGKLEELKREAK